MADHWIVSGHKFKQHATWESADTEAKRLRELTKKDFRIYRVKTTVVSDGGAAFLAAENEWLRAALKPFAECFAASIADDLNADDGMSIERAVYDYEQPTVGDLRRAAKALAEARG